MCGNLFNKYLSLFFVLDDDRAKTPCVCLLFVYKEYVPLNYIIL